MSLRASLLTLRVTAVLLAVLVLLQAALAGGFLGGHYDMLALHGTSARVLTVTALLTAVAAYFVRRAGGPKAPLPLAAVLVVAFVGEIALGIGRAVALHVLFGSVLTACVALLTHRALTTPLPAASPALEPASTATPATGGGDIPAGEPAPAAPAAAVSVHREPAR
ncbi:hypothetical protein AB0G79_14465 [Streptomyces sp. NPDC020807]|uniref:hypothetical protein n=1 Tax=Streptomyces sp. NPDC020807 TaxID=3155119 RepID=UPI003406D051